MEVDVIKFEPVRGDKPERPELEIENERMRAELRHTAAVLYELARQIEADLSRRRGPWH